MSVADLLAMFSKAISREVDWRPNRTWVEVTMAFLGLFFLLMGKTVSENLMLAMVFLARKLYPQCECTELCIGFLGHL